MDIIQAAQTFIGNGRQHTRFRIVKFAFTDLYWKLFLAILIYNIVFNITRTSLTELAVLCIYDDDL
jgi:hypothetical protein